MNRKSLGADIYSPIRFDGSFNDSVVSNADGSISEFYSGAFHTGFNKDNKKSLEPIKDEDFCELQNAESVELFKVPVKRNSKSNPDFFSQKNTNSLFPTSTGSNFPHSPNRDTSPIGNALFQDKSIGKGQVAHEKCPRIKETKNAVKQDKERLVTRRSSKTKHVPDKFITVRRDSRRSNLSPDVPAIGSSDDSQSSMGKENISGLSEVSANSRVDCSSQTDLTLADLQILMNKVDLKSKPSINSECKVPMMSEASLPDPLKQSIQIQANAVEKLKDSMDNEFHDIRQILYFQQLSLSKILYKNLDETESTNSGLKTVAESLNSIVSLLTDDQQLRNTVLSKRYNS